MKYKNIKNIKNIFINNLAPIIILILLITFILYIINNRYRILEFNTSLKESIQGKSNTTNTSIDNTKTSKKNNNIKEEIQNNIVEPFDECKHSSGSKNNKYLDVNCKSSSILKDMSDNPYTIA